MTKIWYRVIELVLFFLGLLIVFLYQILISRTYSLWQNLDETLIVPDSVQKPIRFSIIISARNEASNIENCLASILSLNYGSDDLEIIVVDDHSEDQTRQLAADFDGVRVLENEGQGKKAAMKTGVKASRYEYVWFLDADTSLHPQAALLADTHCRHHLPWFLAAPVSYQVTRGFLNAFQVLDSAVTMAMTAAGIKSSSYFVANGANMIVLREKFLEVGGFEGNDQLASGDDVFLIQKLAAINPEKVFFIKSRRMAVVCQTEKTWTSFIAQRKRWAGKTRHYTHPGLTRLQASVFAMHLIILVWLVAGLLVPSAFFTGLFMLFIKGLIDYLFVHNMTAFFQVSKADKWFIPAFLFYFPYLIYMGFQALIPASYVWKGRLQK